MPLAAIAVGSPKAAIEAPELDIGRDRRKANFCNLVHRNGSTVACIGLRCLPDVDWLGEVTSGESKDSVGIGDMRDGLRKFPSGGSSEEEEARLALSSIGLLAKAKEELRESFAKPFRPCTSCKLASDDE